MRVIDNALCIVLILFLSSVNSAEWHLCPLFRGRFTDVGHAVSEFGSIRFVECWEFYGLPVHEKEIPEIECH